MTLLEHILRKQAFCICENKDADQLCSNCTADLPGVQLLGSTAKNIAESCEISPSVTLKEKSTSPYFFQISKVYFRF